MPAAWRLHARERKKMPTLIPDQKGKNWLLYILAVHISTNGINFYVLVVHRSRSGSNQLEPLSIELHMADGAPVKQKTKKKEPTKKHTTIPVATLDSPAMGTRSKRMAPGSPAMSTRSKRRLSL
jgi:hypothetical protein